MRIKDDLNRKIDYQAERARLRFITPGYGQMMCYHEKVEEATDFLARDNEDLNEFPMLRVQAMVGDTSAKAAAELIIEKHTEMLDAFTRIEEIRMRAKAMISSLRGRNVERRAQELANNALAALADVK